MLGLNSYHAGPSFELIIPTEQTFLLSHLAQINAHLSSRAIVGQVPEHQINIGSKKVYRVFSKYVG